MTDRAHQAYRSGQVRSACGRSVEAEAFARAARLLREAEENPADRRRYLRALEFNQKLWTVIEADVSDPRSRLPEDIRRDILDLAQFVDRQSALAAERPAVDHLAALIEINRNLATGLFSGDA